MNRFITERQKNEIVVVFLFVLIFYIIHQSKIFSNVRMVLPVGPVLSNAVDMIQLAKLTKPKKKLGLGYLWFLSNSENRLYFVFDHLISFIYE